MEDKKLTPQESMEIITQMIEASKQRIAMPDIRISVMWATLSIITAAVVLGVCIIDYNPWINLAWFAIPVIGLPLNFIMTKKAGCVRGAKTAIDHISDGVWKVVGMIGIVLTAICLLFNMLGFPQAWLSMFYYAFIIVGFGATMQGIVIKEGSYVFGGICSIISGFVIIILTRCSIPLLIVWALPLYIVCFLLMFIVPAFIIRRKINSRK